MLQLDKALDQNPTEKQVEQMALARERNLLAFTELQSYNDHGTWRYRHPLIVHKSEHFRLQELFDRNPEEFLKEYNRCANNISRYRSHLKNPARTKEQHKRDRINLQRHTDRRAIFESITGK